MREQEEIRSMYKKYLLETGVNQKFLCLKLGVNESTMSRFKNGKLCLPKYDLFTLKDYIEKSGFLIQ